MSRTSLLPFLLLLLLVPCRFAHAQDRRPNVLFILTDDQAPETLSAYGNTVCRTPNLDRLAREGMILSDAHHMGSRSAGTA